MLTGVNQTDHLKQFENLSLQIFNSCPSIVTVLQSRDCPSVKSAVEALVGGFINNAQDEEQDTTKLKKNQLTLAVLESWFKHNYCNSEVKTSLVVMIADFEQFNSIVVQDLISILCSYRSRLPIILVVGVATAFKTLHNVLPPHITNKLDANVFQSESATSMLNKILDEVILTHLGLFQLSGRSFKVLMDIFLFYDFSLHSFIKGYKVFMLEHFSTNPLILTFTNYEERVASLTHEDCANIRKSCPSFRTLVESEAKPQDRINWISDDEYFKKRLPGRILRLQRYWFQFYCSLRILVVLLDDLPKNELGKLMRELYPICISSDVTTLDEYKECFSLLKFTSKEKFLAKLDRILMILQIYKEDGAVYGTLKKKVKIDLQELLKSRDLIQNAGVNSFEEAAKGSPFRQKKPVPTPEKVKSRQEMMKVLAEGARSNQARQMTEYEKHLGDCIDYLKRMMSNYLRPVSEAPAFHELFVFSDCHSVRRQIVGAPRGALHNALSNPQLYLQCSCCDRNETDRILGSLPDTAIAYKLHLECNKFINLYDWLQAFAMVIDNDGDGDITPEIQ